MIVISSIGCLNGDYNVLNDEELVAIGVDWNTAIELVSELAPIVWTTNHTQETLDYCDKPDPILRKSKLYVDNNKTYVSNFNQETGLIDYDPNATSYVRQEGFDYFFNYEDAITNYKQQVEDKLGKLYTELNYWNKVKASLE